MCWFSVRTGEAGVVEEMGKFMYVAEPGFHCLKPCIQNVSGHVSLRTQHAPIRVDTKTKDNVFVSLSVSIMFQIEPAKVEQAYYSLSEPRQQVESFVHNSIRGQIPQYTLDEAFRLRHEIAKALKMDLDEQMGKYGYVIIGALVTGVDPDVHVKKAMNQINTNLRLKVAMQDASEAQKIETVKAAEADAEAKRLSGYGLAEQRKAILDGLQESVATFKEHVKGTTSTDVMTLLLLNQYFDTLKDVASKGNARVLFTPPEGMDEGSNNVADMRMGMLQGMLGTPNN
eukprot:PhM_4_TR2210/c0_g1_i1/m.8836